VRVYLAIGAGVQGDHVKVGNAPYLDLADLTPKGIHLSEHSLLLVLGAHGTGAMLQ